MPNTILKPGTQLLNNNLQPQLIGQTYLDLYREKHTTRQWLRPGGWALANYRILNFWLDYLQGHPEVDSMTAVLDFDNTCIYHDIGKEVLRYQVAGLHFRLSPEQLAELIPDNPESIGGKPLKLVKRRILELYTKLWPFVKRGHQRTGLRQTECEEFQDILYWYCVEAGKQKGLGPLYTLPLLARLLAGFTVNEVEELTCLALSTALQEPITRQTRVTNYSSVGSIRMEYATGLRVFAEMVDLMDQLRFSGIRCCIVSASTEWVVKAAAKHLVLPVDQENIFGVRVQLAGGDLFTTRLPDDYPVTYRTGKVRVINEMISATPVIVVGDAVTDFEMLKMENVPVRMLINHNKSDLISTLYTDPQILLQGLNKRTGMFWPHRETLDRVHDQQYATCSKYLFGFLLQ
ncbi:MAG: HAD family hydrolase [Thermodesulfobacteriota bacterium]|nr:HAD family hydrolase [Thermodesulfobacteriota bacterium]